jgi:uncharacterized membrane protein
MQVKKMAFKKEIVIDAPVETVFQIATDIENMKHIMEHVLSVELLTEGPLQKGTKMKEVRAIRGGKTEATVEVTDYITNETYSVKSENNGLFVHYHYDFHRKDQGTVVKLKVTIQTTGLINSLLKPMITRIIKKEDKNQLKHLKRYIEEKR